MYGLRFKLDEFPHHFFLETEASQARHKLLLLFFCSLLQPKYQDKNNTEPCLVHTDYQSVCQNRVDCLMTV